MEAILAASADHRTRLFDIIDRQAGYFTAGQAKKAGYSYPNQSYHRKQGHWLDQGWGIFRLRDYPRSEYEPYVRLCLWSRAKTGEPQAVVSHDTALALHELSDVMPAKTHLSVPKGFRKVPPKGVVLHKSQLAAGDSEPRHGFRVTTPLRTLLDVAASPTSPEHLAGAVREALERGLVRRGKLLEALDAAPEGIRRRFGYAGFP